MNKMNTKKEAKRIRMYEEIEIQLWSIFRIYDSDFEIYFYTICAVCLLVEVFEMIFKVIYH